MNPPVPALALAPLSPDLYEDWKTHGISGFAADKQRTHGYTPAEALRLSHEAFDKDLPRGLQTPDQHIFSIFNETGSPVGSTWLAVQTQYSLTRAFVFDIEIIPAERGKGYGRATMVALEAEAKKLGADTIALHVFAFNKVAASLYTSLGYEITDLSMAKKI